MLSKCMKVPVYQSIWSRTLTYQYQPTAIPTRFLFRNAGSFISFINSSTPLLTTSVCVPTYPPIQSFSWYLHPSEHTHLSLSTPLYLGAPVKSSVGATIAIVLAESPLFLHLLMLYSKLQTFSSMSHIILSLIILITSDPPRLHSSDKHIIGTNMFCLL